MDSTPSSNASSRLTTPSSRSPTPPPNFYPSPKSSQISSIGSPLSAVPDMSLLDEDGPPPAKRRKLAESKPRTTEYLDLRPSVAENESEKQQLDRLLKVIRKKRKIVVIAGAGISVSAGIPDFRSSTGLFHTLRSQHNLKASGKHLFDASVYRDDSSTTSFHKMVRSLSHLTKSAKPTPFHHLLARLAHEGRLMRLYTQNVDGIDTALPPLVTEVPLNRKAPWPRTVQLHGGLAKMVCSKCQDLSEFNAELFEGPVPPTCNTCKEVDNIRTTMAGKRSHGIGKLRPRMVLYNEHNPDDEAIGAVTAADLRARPDAVIVVGTTLKVPGVRRIVKEMCGVTRSKRDGVTVWINTDPEPSGIEFKDCWDLVVRGKCDDVARYAALRRWDDDDIGPYQEVTDEELQSIKMASGEVKVLIESPRKESTVWKTHGIITPVASPKIKAWSDCKATQPYPIQGPKPQKNPASKGLSIASIVTKGSLGAKKPGLSKKPSASKKSASNKDVAEKGNKKITQVFNVTKGQHSVVSKAEAVPKMLNPGSKTQAKITSKPKPNAHASTPWIIASSTESAKSATRPRKRKRTGSEIPATTTAQQSQPMTPIRSEAARRNSVLTQEPPSWSETITGWPEKLSGWTGKLTKYKDDGVLSESSRMPSVEGDSSPKRSPMMSPIK